MALALPGPNHTSLAAPPRLLAERVAHWAWERPSASAYTFVDHSDGGPGERHTLTWEQTHLRTEALATRLRQVCEPGDRVAILAPQGLDYVVAMLAAMRAGVTAVPLFSPLLPRHGQRLTAVLADCAPTCVLTTVATRPHVERFLHDEAPAPRPRHVVAVDEATGDATAPTVAYPPSPEITTDAPATDDVAYLQYSSGSTRVPTGAQITHGNLLANTGQIVGAIPFTPGRSVVASWLPLFHDMGLVSAVAMPLLSGSSTVLMDPLAFVMRPLYWLQLLSEHGDVVGGAPNFAYDHCVRRVEPDERRGLDLSGVRALLNGAEPVRAATVERFTAAFAPHGLAPEAHCAAYGLAEATVFVSVDSASSPPPLTSFDRSALAAGHAHPVPEGTPGAQRLVACGAPYGQQVAIADPGTGRQLADGEVGEIWVRGPNVAAGYWRRDGGSTFDAVLTHAETGEISDGWLRTGDLGALVSGRLYVTGRAKDVIIVDGRNHYPQDIEETVHVAHPAIRRDRVAAFAVPDTDGGEHIVVVAETTGDTGDGADPREVAGHVRRAVTASHDLRLHDVVLVGKGAVVRTSSGKLARHACRRRYLDGGYADARRVSP